MPMKHGVGKKTSLLQCSAGSRLYQLMSNPYFIPLSWIGEEKRASWSLYWRMKNTLLLRWEIQPTRHVRGNRKGEKPSNNQRKATKATNKGEILTQLCWEWEPLWRAFFCPAFHWSRSVTRRGSKQKLLWHIFVYPTSSSSRQILLCRVYRGVARQLLLFLAYTCLESIILHVGCGRFAQAGAATRQALDIS